MAYLGNIAIRLVEPGWKYPSTGNLAPVYKVTGTLIPCFAAPRQWVADVRPLYQISGQRRTQVAITTKEDGFNLPLAVEMRVNGAPGVSYWLSGQPLLLSGVALPFTAEFLVDGAVNGKRTEVWGPYTFPPHVPLSISGAYPGGTVNVAYAASITVAGVGGTSTWYISGDLPPGLTFSDGDLTGTPTTAGTYPFTTTLVDSFDNAMRYINHTVTVAP